MNVARHPEAHSWLDFTRGLVEPAQRTHMERHLASCGSCQRWADRLGRLLADAGEEARSTAPDWVLERARAVYTPPSPATRPGTIPARLLYDSLRDPLPAGVRAADRPSQALYQADRYRLDLHLGKDRTTGDYGSPRAVVVGQIANRKAPWQPMSEVPVRLVQGGKVVARGVSNEFGEFHLEFDPRRPSRLEVAVEEDRRIEVRLRSQERGRPA